MGAVAANVVGLGKFFLILTTFLIPARLPRVVKTKEERDGKYKYLVGPSEEVIGGIETKFCPKCHAPAAQFRRTKQGTQIIRDGKVKATFGNNVTISTDGKEQKGFPINCPNGHKVKVE